MEMGQDMRPTKIRDLLESAAAVHQQNIFDSIGKIVLDHQRSGIGQVDDFGELQSCDAITVERSLVDVPNQFV